MTYIFKEELSNYINNNIQVFESISKSAAIPEKEKTSFFGSFKKIKSVIFDENYECDSIDDYIDQNKDDNKFQKLLFKYIDDRELKDSDVYNKVNIDRRLFSKIRSNEDYHPSKETIILLGISLELSIDELTELLESASYSLPKNNKYDLIIRYCFENKIYNIDDINEALYDYGFNTL